MDHAAPDPVVIVEGLSFRFPGRDGFALSVPSLRIARGEHTAMVGASGCGKTTLLRLITGSLRAETGRVVTLGRDLASMREPARRAVRLREIGMVFQSFALVEYLSALDNILLTARLGAGAGRRADRAHAQDLARRVGIGHTLRKPPARLSQGERQRVAICRALVTRPPLIVCDEPTGNLDPARSRGAVDLILREADAIGATVLLVTHDHGLLDAFGRVVRLDGAAA